MFCPSLRQQPRGTDPGHNRPHGIRHRGELVLPCLAVVQLSRASIVANNNVFLKCKRPTRSVSVSDNVESLVCGRLLAVSVTRCNVAARTSDLVAAEPARHERQRSKQERLGGDTGATESVASTSDYVAIAGTARDERLSRCMKHGARLASE